MPLVHRLANTGTLQTTTYFDEYTQGYWSNYFSGAASYPYLSNATGTAFTFGTSDFTIEYWAYQTATCAAYSTHCGQSLTAGGFSCMVDSGNGIYGTTQAVGYGTGVAMPINQWVHIAWLRSGTTLKCYLNGNNIYTNASFGTNLNETGFGIGGQKDGSYAISVPTSLSNIRVVQGTAVYNSNFTPSTTPLTAISGTSLLTCQSSNFKDNSINNFTITVNGTVTSNTLTPFSKSPRFTANNIIGQLDEVSNLQGSILLNGTNQYLSAPTNTAFTFGTGDFTVEAWVYATGSSFGRITNRQPAAGLTGSWGFNFSSTYFGFSEIIVGEPIVTASGLPTMLNTWTHLAASRQGSTLRLFANGILVGSGTFTNDLSASSYPLGIGASYETYFPGYISNIRIVKGTALYTSTFNPKTLPTNVANTSLLLNTFTSQPFKDSSNNNFTITNVNSATSNTFTPPISLTQYPYVLSPSLRLANTAIMYSNGQFDEITKLIPPPAIGDPYGGGYYAGQISLTANGVATHNLIVADRTVGQAYGKKWGVVGVETGVTSIIDGPGNSTTLAALGSTYEAATFCKAVTAGGYNDWYMPANNELNQLYFYFKPYATDNHTGYGSNAYAVSPQPINTNYTASNPPITPLTNFQNGASSQEFSLAYYWASTQETTGTAKHQFFFGGSGSGNYKDNTDHYVRAVRRVPV